METHLKYGIYENSLETVFGGLCNDVAKYFKRSLNITYDGFGDISANENNDFQSNSIFKNEYDIAFLPYSMNGGWYYIHYSYTLPVTHSDIVIISGAPAKMMETSFSGYFVFKKDVLVCLCLSLIITSAIGTLLKTVMRRPVINQLNQSIAVQIATDFGNHVWNYFWSFFRIPVPNIKHYISYRLLTWSWLVTVLCVSSQLNGSFTARVSKISYDTYDNFKDVKTELLVRENSFEHNIIRFKAKEEELIEKLLSEINLNERYYSSFSLLFDDDFLKRVNNSEITIVSTTFLFRVMSHYKQKDENWRLYVSPRIAPAIHGFLISNNVSSSLKEAINIRIGWIFESKSYENIVMECDRYATLHKWRVPSVDSEVYPLTLNDTYAGTVQFVISVLISILCLFLEKLNRFRGSTYLPNNTKIFVRQGKHDKKKRICIEFEIDDYQNIYNN